MQTKNSFLKLLLVIFILTLYRFIVLYNSNINLYVDEAYYWGWSRYFDFGYYSKPPVIAWVISIFTSICGNGVFCVKFPALVFYPLTTVIIYFITKELFDERKAFWAGVVFITLPAVSMSSMIISTDVVFLFFWALTLLLFIKALKTNKDFYWILVGFSGGFGLLSKYTMIIFPLSVFVYLLFSKTDKKHLKNPKLYMSMILAALTYLPNLLWNYRHHFVTFMHTKEISEIDRNLFHLNKMFDFLGAQFGVFGLIFFAVLLFLVFKPHLKDDRYKLLYSFTYIFLGVITLQSFLSRAFANWAAPTYIAATILVSVYLVKKNRLLLLKIGIIINLVLAIFLYHYHFIAKTFNIELTRKTDPYKRVLSWDKLANEVSKVLKKYPNARLLSDSRKVMAELIYYIKPHPFDAGYWNPQKELKNNYELMIDLNRYKSKDFIYITKKSSIDNMRKYFKEVKKIRKIDIKLYKDFSRDYYLYFLQDFKGY